MPPFDLKKILFNRGRLRRPAAMVAMLVLVLLGYDNRSAVSGTYEGEAVVTDGDTIKIGAQRFRLYGIDAPESLQTCMRDGKDYPCGQQATLALSDLIGRQTVRCRKKDTDMYGRKIAICFVGTTDLNQWMVAHGYAVAYRHYSNHYVPDENAAKAAKLGIWAGTFEMPWDFRHRQHPLGSAISPTAPE